MQRLRTTFTRSRTPTGAEMKTQNSLEVPKQVRSASFDEMQLEAQRVNASLLKQHSSASADDRSCDAGFLQVPQPTQQQRSHSFDSTAGSDDSGAFLEVARHSKMRRSGSSAKTPPPCIHCLYLEQYQRQVTAEQRYFIDHRELQTLSYSYSSTDDDDDDNNGDDLNIEEGGLDEEADDDDGASSGGGVALDDDDDDAALEMDIRLGGLNSGSSIEESRARLPRQMRRHTIGSSIASTSEDEGLEESEYGSPHYGNTLLPPPQTTPCGITFTLSPTDDYPQLPADSSAYAFPIDPSSPPPSPAFSLSVCGSPVLELPPPPPMSPLELLPHSPSLDLPLPPPPAFSGASSFADTNASVVPPLSSSDCSPAALRPRRRSISRQEAIFVEPTGNSLENVSHEEEVKPTRVDSADEVSTAAANERHAFVVRDIYLTVPDLKRDRAASVDSCFSKLSSGGKTQEVQPSSEGCFLTVPSINATRSRSVDIVLPTDEQARYKALAMTGASGQYGQGRSRLNISAPTTKEKEFNRVIKDIAITISKNSENRNSTNQKRSIKCTEKHDEDGYVYRRSSSLFRLRRGSR